MQLVSFLTSFSKLVSIYGLHKKQTRAVRFESMGERETAYILKLHVYTDKIMVKGELGKENGWLWA
jgi:hypothetical protein